jgi:hypothetical protein
MSELTVQIIILLLVLLAIGFGIMALGVRFIFRRSPRIPGALAAMCVLMALAAPGLQGEPYSQREADRIEAARLRFAPALEKYRQAHGEYPPTPEAAGVTMPRTPYGGRLYYFAATSNGVPTYHLAYGNNEIHGFEALWSTGTGTWVIHRWARR